MSDKDMNDQSFDIEVVCNKNSKVGKPSGINNELEVKNVTQVSFVGWNVAFIRETNRLVIFNEDTEETLIQIELQPTIVKE